MSELKLGATIRLKNGNSCIVKKELGRGGQGIVYLVDYNNEEYALKWYTEPTIVNNRSFYKNLENNVNRVRPADNFLWPLAITERQLESFGYVMELRPKDYHDMGEFLLGHTHFNSIHAQLNACLQLSAAFQKLHIIGYSYQDMNDGNFFISPKTGDVLICDNDNVSPNGTNSGIAGKAGYMAPEIVEGVKSPSIYTDNFSLAVCLFILIYMNRPFEGAWYLSCPCDNNPMMSKQLMGFNAVFIMDKENAKNRPVPGVHNNVIRRWSIYPEILADAFCQCFSNEAIKDPTKRLMDKQWHELLLQVRSMLVPCPNCKRYTFIEPEHHGKPCAWCKNPTSAVAAMKVGRYTIPLLDGQALYDCQVADNADFNVISGKVMFKGEIGIMNVSNYLWTVTLPDGSSKVVQPGSGFPARDGFKIKFGNQGEIGEISNENPF